MMVEELIAVSTPRFALSASRVGILSAAAGETRSAKFLCPPPAVVIVATIFCGAPEAFCVSTFMMSP